MEIQSPQVELTMQRRIRTSPNPFQLLLLIKQVTLYLQMVPLSGFSVNVLAMAALLLLLPFTLISLDSLTSKPTPDLEIRHIMLQF